MTTVYWFRTDLRLADNRALRAACANSARLLPVYCVAPSQTDASAWDAPRMGMHRRRYLAATLADLDARLRRHGSRLAIVRGEPEQAVAAIARAAGARRVVCEDLPAPEESDAVAALRHALRDQATVETHWQSTLFDPDALPFDADAVPDVFTAFRQAVERAGVAAGAPLPAPAQLPPPPPLVWPDERQSPLTEVATALGLGADLARADDPRTALPYRSAAFAGGETAGLAHLQRYFAGDAAQRYKQTRNALAGVEDSTKFSPWLATGALSARQIAAALARHEAERGATEDSRWILFELLWRDHFRWLHRKYGRRLYRAAGLGRAPAPTHDADAHARWRAGRTGHALVDAGMRELAATGYLSNRMRQIVASACLHECGGDWRAGAAWFESQLIDYDVHSNHGNWLYLAGRGTDPRGGRRFDLDKQAREHDRDGRYRANWSHP